MYINLVLVRVTNWPACPKIFFRMAHLRLESAVRPTPGTNGVTYFHLTPWSVLTWQMIILVCLNLSGHMSQLFCAMLFEHVLLERVFMFTFITALFTLQFCFRSSRGFFLKLLLLSPLRYPAVQSPKCSPNHLKYS